MGLDKKRVAQYGKEIERRRGLSLIENMKTQYPIKKCKDILFTTTRTPLIAIGRNIDQSELNKLGGIIATHDAISFIPTNYNHKIYTIKYDDTEVYCEPEGKESVEKSKEEWDKIMTLEMESVLLGTKAGLKSRERKMSELELHMRHGHVGRSGGKCTICNLLRGSFRRIYSKTSPYFEQRVGHTFSGDVITWSDESRQGSKYCMVMRDFGSGFFFVIHLSKRNEVTRKLEALITQIRADPIFKGHKHQIMSTLKLDPAGEWRDDNENFHKMTSRTGVNIKYSSPDDKRSHAHGENAVKQIEITTRSILLNRALPTSFVEDAAHQATAIRNLYPLQRECVSNDGDALRPLEAITMGKVSRRECDNRLHHLIPLGTPCLIYTPKTKSSNLQLPKARWGIAIRMDQDMPIFFCPFRGPNNTFRSKNYVEYSLGIGINYYQFLGIEEPTMPKIHFPTTGKTGTNITTITQIEDLSELVNEDRYGPPPIQSVRDRGGGAKPLVILTDQHGWIYETDTKGDIVKTSRKLDNDNDITTNEATTIPMVPIPRGEESRIMNDPNKLIGRKFWKTFDGYDPCEGTISKYHPKEKLWTAKYPDGDQEDFDLEDIMIHVMKSPPTKPSDPPPEGEHDNEPYEDRISTARLYSCKEGENYFNVCDSIGLALHLRKPYYEWLGHDFGLFGEVWDPSKPDRVGIYFNHPWNKGARTRFRRGTKFPIPHGSSW